MIHLYEQVTLMNNSAMTHIHNGHAPQEAMMLLRHALLKLKDEADEDQLVIPSSSLPSSCHTSLCPISIVPPNDLQQKEMAATSPMYSNGFLIQGDASRKELVYGAVLFNLALLHHAQAASADSWYERSKLLSKALKTYQIVMVVLDRLDHQEVSEAAATRLPWADILRMVALNNATFILALFKNDPAQVDRNLLALHHYMSACSESALGQRGLMAFFSVNMIYFQAQKLMAPAA